jgi:DNA-binding PadR family transcriptional regulator
MDIETDLHAYLPLTEATFFILFSLSEGPKHGYAIMKGVNQMSNGRINLSTGTLYGVLKRLLDAGWIVREGEDEADVSTRVRKNYSLTGQGNSVLGMEVARMRELVELSASVTVSGF